ncbi:MAG: hypothetical protein PV344_03090 [Anaplasma sp.]|nr:hypothetical protein [Anaplasma sp.]
MDFRKQCRSGRWDATNPTTPLIKRYLPWMAVFLEKKRSRLNEADEARDVNISRFLLSSLPHLKAAKRRRREAVSSPSRLFSEKQDVNISVKRVFLKKKKYGHPFEISPYE